VWAPGAEKVDVVLEESGAPPSFYPMKKSVDGYFSATVTHASPGSLYRYRIDGKGPFPDPASRFQPQGVHGPSQIVDPSSFVWSDSEWKGIDASDLIFYELHTGTFSPEGTFQGVEARLPLLQSLGVTALELMPVADFPGGRNWGYDVAAFFAPARCYGSPDDLRHLVDRAHNLGLAVFLDVVYNHFGPDGAYHRAYSPNYVSASHKSPWGDGLNFDGPMSSAVRDYFIENAVRWVVEYHLDGLRLDATHAIADDSPRHILASVSSSVRAAVAESGRIVHLISEDVRNLNSIVKPESGGGWGLDGVWSDDFHHQVRRALAGDQDGYYRDFAGTAPAIAETARKGWFYCGQDSAYFENPRGSDPAGVDYSKFVFFIQNHDQVGNRASGDRLHHTVDLPAYRAAAALLLLLPETPLVFMGQEWAATAPFLFFTDHNEELGKRVTEGRRQEFRKFERFADPEACKSIPDPQAVETFEASRLDWDERRREPHLSTLRFFSQLLHIRRNEPALRSSACSGELCIEALDEDVLALRRAADSGEAVLAVVRLRRDGRVTLHGHEVARVPEGAAWECLLTTEDEPFTSDRTPMKVRTSPPEVHFQRPGAAVFRTTKASRP
jgi:maltooligosyltrehalose trehalohydrolase